MTHQLRAALSGLTQPRDDVAPSSAAFPSVDADSMAATLQIEQRGREAGAQNIPSADSTEPDANEQQIASTFAERAREARRVFEHELDLYDRRAQRHNISAAHQVEIESAGESALADFVALIKDDLDHLYLARDQVRTTEADLSRFKTDHRLTRGARIVGSGQRLLRWLIIVIILLTEAIANGLFFAPGSSSGIIGGVAQALGFATINIGVMVLAARYFLPWLMYRNYAVKLVGLILLSAAFAWCLALNLTLAHFRDLYIAGSSEVALTDLMARIQSDPLTLGQVQSWLLAVLGIGFAIVAFIDAYGLGDPYPGYERVATSRANSVQLYTEDKSACLEGLMARRDEAVGAMNDAIAVLHRSQHEYQLALQGRQRLHAQFAEHLNGLAQTGVLLISRYRQANQTARSEPAPEFYARAISLAQMALFQVAPLPRLSDTDAKVLDEVAARMRDYLKRVNARYEQALQEYDSVYQLAH